MQDMYIILFECVACLPRYAIIYSICRIVSIGSLACQVHKAHQELANHSTKCSSLSALFSVVCFEFPSFHRIPPCFPQVEVKRSWSGLGTHTIQMLVVSVGNRDSPWLDFDSPWSTKRLLIQPLVKQCQGNRWVEGLVRPMLHPD